MRGSFHFDYIKRKVIQLTVSSINDLNNILDEIAADAYLKFRGLASTPATLEIPYYEHSLCPCELKMQMVGIKKVINPGLPLQKINTKENNSERICLVMGDPFLNFCILEN